MRFQLAGQFGIDRCGGCWGYWVTGCIAGKVAGKVVGTVAEASENWASCVTGRVPGGSGWAACSAVVCCCAVCSTVSLLLQCLRSLGKRSVEPRGRLGGFDRPNGRGGSLFPAKLLPGRGDGPLDDAHRRRRQRPIINPSRRQTDQYNQHHNSTKQSSHSILALGVFGKRGSE